MAKRKKEIKETDKKAITVNQLTEEIRKKANEIYLKRVKANKPGDELSDWLEAEKIIKEKYDLN